MSLGDGRTTGSPWIILSHGSATVTQVFIGEKPLRDGGDTIPAYDGKVQRHFADSDPLVKAHPHLFRPAAGGRCRSGSSRAYAPDLYP
jgi:hypothetical protein